MSTGLYRKDILRYLKFGQPPRLAHTQAFYGIISEQYDAIAASYGCEVKLVEINLLRAQEIWAEDIDKIVIDEGSEPDHFKHAGWLCHWLRKKMPVSGIIIRDESKLEKHFEDYYNELIAFQIGLKLVIFHECCKRRYDDEMIIETVKKFSLGGLLHDVVVYLSHKNVSPHAIYLLYKAIVFPSSFQGDPGSE